VSIKLNFINNNAWYIYNFSYAHVQLQLHSSSPHAYKLSWRLASKRIYIHMKMSIDV
jgi:hypothetical protein